MAPDCIISNNMKNVIVTDYFSEKEKSKLTSLFENKLNFIFVSHEEFTDALLANADIIVGPVPHEKLTRETVPELKLLQLTFAGSDGEAALNLFHGEDAPLLCNATGAYGVTISEYVIGALITLLRHFQLYRDQMHENRWEKLELPETIFGKTALLLGTGDIGGNIAKRLKAFGCRVIAIKRTPYVPENVDEVHTLADLETLLPLADFICCSLPNSSETRKIINEKTLALMKKSAILVNVGRGTLVDADALAAAIENHLIAGAALDVTDPEPLPENHPLWQLDNCLITPHVAGLSIQRDPHERIFNIVCENLSKFINGESLENIVDVSTGYRRSSR